MVEKPNQEDKDAPGNERKVTSWSVFKESLFNTPTLIVTMLYVYIAAIGIVYSWALYRMFGINIFDYSEIADFLLAAFKNAFALLSIVLIAAIGATVESLTCSPKTGPVTMRVQQPTIGTRRTLYGQTTLPGADRPQAPPGGGKASCRVHSTGGGQGTRRKRSYLPSLEKPLRRDEHQRSQAPQGAGERECSPQEAACREGAGHRHPKGGEPGKLLSPTRRRAAVEHVRQRLG